MGDRFDYICCSASAPETFSVTDDFTAVTERHMMYRHRLQRSSFPITVRLYRANPSDTAPKQKKQVPVATCDGACYQICLSA